MSKPVRERSRSLSPFLLVGCISVVIIGLISWVVVTEETGWDVGTQVGALVGIIGALLTVLGSILLLWLSEYRKSPDEHEQLESVRTQLWEAIRSTRIDRGPGDKRAQLDLMLTNTARMPLTTVEAKWSSAAGGAPKLTLTGPRVLLNIIIERWCAEPNRLVILGEPGAGKTVAALQLCRAINLAAEAKGSRIAEIFPLAEWGPWHRSYPKGGITDWLVSQLSDRYGVVPETGRLLLNRGHLIPILDGLDELPDSDRRQCHDRIKAFSGTSVPYLPFVLTSRAFEYRELAPNWIEADKTIALTVLDKRAILSVLDGIRLDDAGWTRIRDAVAADDRNLIRLFSVPLRLSAAIQVFGQRDPSVLIGRSPEEATSLLWKSKLAGQGSDESVHEQGMSNRGVLWLASAMKRKGKQDFWLHDLYLYAPQRPRTFTVFKFVSLGGGAAFLTFVLWRGYEAFHAARVFQFSLGPEFGIAALIGWSILIVSLVFWAADLSIKEKPSAGLQRANPVKTNEALKLLRRKMSKSFAASAGLSLVAGGPLALHHTDTVVVVEVMVVILALSGLGLGAISYLRALSPLADGSDIGVRGPMDLVPRQATLAL